MLPLYLAAIWVLANLNFFKLGRAYTICVHVIVLHKIYHGVRILLSKLLENLELTQQYFNSNYSR